VVAAVAVHAATARLPLARAIEFVPQLNVAAQRIGITLN
jgi:DNA-binding IclR family transcriptional regulator